MSQTFVVRHDEQAHQFEVLHEGNRAYLAYMNLGKQTLDFYRTFVPVELRGLGIAAVLTREALTYAREQGYTVIPSCSYVERYLEREDGVA